MLYNGTGPLQKKVQQKTLQQLQPSTLRFARSLHPGDIKSVDELKGKRVSVGDAGSGVEFNARQILEAYGISFDDIQVNNLWFPGGFLQMH